MSSFLRSVLVTAALKWQR